MTERRADEATRDVVNWLKCEYLMDRVGEHYTGVVSAVTGFGLFVMLDELFVEGLVHITGLPKDYYYHETSQHRLVGERTGRVYRLGQQLAVRVVRVNLEERKIDFELDDSATEKQGLKSKESARKTAKRSGNRSRKTAGVGYSGKGKESTSRRKSKASSKKTGKKRSK